MKTLKDKPFALIGVNIVGQTPEKLKQVMLKEKLPWRSFADTGIIGQGPISATWNYPATPTFYIIDQKGVIRNKWIGSPGPKTIDDNLEKLFAESEKPGLPGPK